MITYKKTMKVSIVIIYTVRYQGATLYGLIIDFIHKKIIVLLDYLINHTQLIHISFVDN
jgi:hypothetical protein